ncbi:hypothetical protein ATERTT37_003820 [Aspergillus terreus]
MVKFAILTGAIALGAAVSAQCGSGTPDATVNGEDGSYTASVGSEEVYSGDDYYTAIQTALDAISSGQRLSVIASGSIGTNVISISSGKTFEGCGTIDVGFNEGGRGAIESLDTDGVSIPYLSMTGNPYFGMRFYGVTGLSLGTITMNLSGGLGIRFERDEAANADVSMDSITVTGAGSHAVETWNIDGLTINEVIARDVGECGLLLQTTTNAQVGLVDGDNVAAGTGYATFRMANTNGRLADGSYTTNVFVDNVISRGGGRGVFCVSESGGVEIRNVDLADNGNNAILIENCYGVSILGGTVEGGGEVRLAARDEFENNRDVSITLEVNGNSVTENPCGENISWDIAVGGTSGIALSTATALARHTRAPKIYLIGRSQSAANSAIDSIKTINPSAQPTFLQADISLLKNVDSVCAEIASKEQKLNLLFMTPGYFTLKGRDETAEGLDRKFALHYYARMRFINQLLPLLRAAAEDPSVDASARLSRVVSVLDPHAAVRARGTGTLDYSDLSLKNTFTLAKCAAHASLMGNFYLEDMARQHPQTSFVHAYPSGVATGIMREIPGGNVLAVVLKTLLRPFMVPLEESGERHLFAATSGKFPPKVDGARAEGDVAVGSDGAKGSGCYWVNWDGEALPSNKKLDKTRETGAVEKVVQHTNEVFEEVCGVA